MRRSGRLVAWACTLALAVLPVTAQVTVEPKAGEGGKGTDTFVVKSAGAQPLEVSLLRVRDYPAQEMPKACQDPHYRGLQVQGAWFQAVLAPAPDAVVSVYDRTQGLERMGFPAFPLASVQGPGWHATLNWVTAVPVKALPHCRDEGRYNWWYIDSGGAQATYQGLLLDITGEGGREWYLIEKCGEAPATVRKLEGPGGAAEMACPPGK